MKTIFLQSDDVVSKIGSQKKPLLFAGISCFDIFFFSDGSTDSFHNFPSRAHLKTLKRLTLEVKSSTFRTNAVTKKKPIN